MSDIIFNVYDRLTGHAAAIRSAVFVVEQSFVNEFDDADDTATHIVGYIDRKPAAVCRIIGTQCESAYLIGRIAVMKEFRGASYGSKLIEKAESIIRKAGGQEARISAQVRASGFYEKCGYVKTGEEYLDEGCPHILMIKKL